MKPLARLATLLLFLALAACGGGTQTGVGSGGSGAPLALGIGTVTGFGSVIVHGERYDETQAEVLVDERPDRLTPATVAAIRLGVRVEFTHRERVITRATVGAEVIGPVASVSADRLTVLGQTVIVNASPRLPTVFEGFRDLSELAGGAVVEVHGERSADGAVLATRVVRRPDTLTVARVAGVATAVEGRNYTVGSLRVVAGDAVLVGGTAVTAGARVVAWTDVRYGGGPLVAKVLRVGSEAVSPAPAPAAVPMTLEGVIAALQVPARFALDGVTVDAATARFDGGTAADLSNGRPVRVRGSYAAGVLRADSVEFLAAQPVAAELNGPVADFVDAARPFRVREAAARVTPQTTYSGGTAANLGNGVLVRVEGPVVNGVVEARTLEFLPPPPDAQRTVAGTIVGPISAATPAGERSFRLAGTSDEVRTTPSTAYRNGSAADLAAGRQVRVRGALAAGQLIAVEVEFTDGAGLATVEVDGVAGDVTAVAFVVNGQSIRRDAATAYTIDGTAATAAALVNGVSVRVVATRSADVLRAASIDIVPEPVGSVRVRGLVSGRPTAGATEFLVGAQRVRVDAGTQIVPGNRTLADVVNGADVEVDGTVSGGVLLARRIRLR